MRDANVLRLSNASFPQAVIMPMKYAETVLLTCTGGAVATYKFRLNSVYDPNLTGAGHKTFYTDQMDALYGISIVTGCKVEVTFTSGSTAAINCVIAPSIASVTPVDADTAREKYGGQGLVLSPSNGPVVLEDYFDIAKLWGTNREEILSDDSWQGTATTNPTAVTYLNITCKPVDGATTSTVYAAVKLTQYVYWKQKKQQDEST